MVTVYTIPSCAQCDSTKRYLTKHMIEYTEIDMSKDEVAYSRVKEMGYTQAPVVEYGDEHWSGFRFEKLAKIAA